MQFVRAITRSFETFREPSAICCSQQGRVGYDKIGLKQAETIW